VINARQMFYVTVTVTRLPAGRLYILLMCFLNRILNLGTRQVALKVGVEF